MFQYHQTAVDVVGLLMTTQLTWFHIHFTLRSQFLYVTELSEYTILVHVFIAKLLLQFFIAELLLQFWDVLEFSVIYVAAAG